MPFKEIHADIKVQRPIGLRGHHTGIHPQIAVALIQNAPITLALAGDVLHRSVGQGGLVTECEMLVYAQGLVDPVPLRAIAMQFK